MTTIASPSLPLWLSQMGGTFSRASVAQRFDAGGLHEAVQANLPRIDHAPGSGDKRGLLLEEARTNLLLYSDAPSNAAWVKTNLTVAASATQLAGMPTSRLTAGAGTGVAARLAQSVTKAAAALTYTGSVYAKLSGVNFLVLSLDNGTGVQLAVVTFDLANGDIEVAPSVSGSFTNPIASIEPVGGGVYKCTLTATTDTSTTIRFRLDFVSATGSLTWNPVGTEYALYAGMQLEAGGFATSYIPTAAAAAARAADVLYFPPTLFYRSPFSLFIEFQQLAEYPQLGATGVIIGLANTTADTVQVRALSTGDQLRVSAASGGVNSADITPGAQNTGVRKVALRAATSDMRAIADGGTLGSNATFVPMTSVARMRLGGRPGVTSATEPFNGWIRKVRFYPSALSDADLTALVA